MKISLTMTLLAGFAAASAAPPGPADLPRAEICLNGAWDVVLDAAGDKIPSEGGAPRRVPAMPLTASPVPVSAWYRHSFQIPREWAKPGRSFFLRLDKVAHYAAVYSNGRRIGEHYGQFTPFEVDLTSAFEPGKTNEIAIFVHNASGRYVRPGADVDAALTLGYRPQNDAAVRNWIGIVGDVTLSWRPSPRINAIGVRADADGKAWVAVQQPGAFRLFHRNGSREIVIRPGRLPRSPGYENVQRVNVAQ